MSEQEPGLRLIVGLGNPGPTYARTRHNAGFWFADEVAGRHLGVFRPEVRFGGELCRVSAGGRDLWVLKPMTYMNRCGQSVARMAAYYKLPPPSILVAHDDLDLSPGTVRLKRSGGHGGHNGLRDIIRWLGSTDFLRLRFGIGHPGASDEVVDYVLHPPSVDDDRAIRDAVASAAGELSGLAEGELERVMHLLHSRP